MEFKSESFDCKSVENHPGFTIKQIFQKEFTSGTERQIVKYLGPDKVLAVVLNKSSNKYVVLKEIKYGITENVINCVEGFVQENPEENILHIVTKKIGAINPVVVTPLFAGYEDTSFMNSAVYAFYVEVDSYLPSKEDLVLEVDLKGLANITLNNPNSTINQQFLYLKFCQYLGMLKQK